MKATQSPQDKYIARIKEIVLSRVDPKKVMVFLFGSRTRPGHPSRADVDIGLMADEQLPYDLYHKIRNALDDASVPLEVDIIDFTRADDDFRESALKEIIVWNMPRGMKKSGLSC